MDLQTDLQKEIIGCYADGPEHLKAVINGLTEDDLDLCENGQGWSIRQYVHHIVDGDDIWKTFIKWAIGNPRGIFQLNWYWQMPQDEWVKAWQYANREVEPSLALFKANRAHVVQLLRLIPGALEKRLTVCLPDGKEEQATVQDVIEMQTRHVAGHIADIQRILAEHRECGVTGGQS